MTSRSFLAGAAGCAALALAAGGCAAGGSRAVAVGEWSLASMSVDTQSASERDLAMLDGAGMSLGLVVSADGTAVFDVMGEDLPATWTTSRTGIRFIFDGDSRSRVDGRLSEGHLSFAYDGVALSFVRMEEAEEADELSQPFDSVHEWPDGLTVAVSQPQEFEPSDSASASLAGATGTALVFDVAVVNGTGGVVDSRGFVSDVLSDSQQARVVLFDADAEVEPVTVDLLPGKELRYRVAFVVADPDDVQFSWSDGTDRQTAYFVR